MVLVNLPSQAVFVKVHAESQASGMQRAHSIQSIPSSETGDSAANLLQARKSGSAEDLRSTAVSGLPKAGLPESPSFLAASKFFSEPLNDKLVRLSATGFLDMLADVKLTRSLQTLLVSRL